MLVLSPRGEGKAVLQILFILEGVGFSCLPSRVGGVSSICLKVLRKSLFAPLVITNRSRVFLSETTSPGSSSRSSLSSGGRSILHLESIFAAEPSTVVMSHYASVGRMHKCSQLS